MNTSLLNQFVPAFSFFLTAEALLPWGLLWLSDEFLFEVPYDTVWVASGSPVLLMVAAVLRILLRNSQARQTATSRAGRR